MEKKASSERVLQCVFKIRYVRFHVFFKILVVFVNI